MIVEDQGVNPASRGARPRAVGRGVGSVEREASRVVGVLVGEELDAAGLCRTGAGCCRSSARTSPVLSVCVR